MAHYDLNARRRLLTRGAATVVAAMANRWSAAQRHEAGIERPADARASERFSCSRFCARFWLLQRAARALSE